MQKRSLKNYTLRYLVIAILGIIAVWAALFYMFIIEEVYDNIDDGLKDSKLRILREVERNPELLQTGKYGIAQFKITPLPPKAYSQKSHIYNTEMFMPYEDEDEPVRVLQTIFSTGNRYYQLEIYTSTVEEDELLEDLLTALVILYVTLVASIMLINHFILKKAWSPFYELLEKLKNYQIGGHKNFERTTVKVKEFDELNNELLAMINRNEAIYSQQKQFIANASHELQTPLAIATNKLELLMEEQGLTEKHLLKINEVNQTLNRLKKLNRSLLTLSRIENRQFQPSENINLNDIVHQILTELESLIEFKEIKVTVEEKAGFQVEMNRDLGIILISNLLKNAIVHNPKGGLLKVSITDKEISIQNSGGAPLNPQHIFERFYKDEQSEHSTGLGLAIVKSIIGLYPGFTIDYRFENAHYFILRSQ